MIQAKLMQVQDAKCLKPEDQAMLTELLKVWKAKLQRNKIKNLYYDGKNRLENIGIAIPDELKVIESVVSWPEKAVDELEERAQFDGFILDGPLSDDIHNLLDDNNFDLMYPQAVINELINSCSFATVSLGGAGDPGALVSFYSAENAAGIWDGRKKRLQCGFAIVDTDKIGSDYEPTQINLYTDTDIVVINKSGDKWIADYRPHIMGRPCMEPLTYRPSLKRPFGKSRITRSVIAITNNTVREILRAELASEFNTTPQKYMLGVDPEAIEKTKWELYIGSFLMASKDEDGDIPTVGQFPQASFQPHIDYMRSLAAQMAGASSLPISSLGVIHDNPSSAEAIYAEESELIRKADNLNKTNGIALKNIARMLLAVVHNTSFSMISAETRNIKPRFKPTSQAPISTLADAVSKLVSALPYMADSDVTLEILGLPEEQIARLRNDRRRGTSSMFINQLGAQNDQQANTTNLP